MSIAARAIRGAKVCLIPMPANDDRPLALRHPTLVAISTLLVIAKVLATGIILLTPASADLATITAARIVQLTNAERAQAGLPELTVNALLASAAVQKGNHMLAEDYFAHISPSGVTPWFWMSKVGYSYQVAGENLAIDFIEAENVVAAWLASPSHRQNMLHEQYTQTGVGVVTGEFEGGTSTIVVHMFGLPSGATAAVAATPTPTPAVQSSTSQASPTPTPTPTPTSAVPADTTPPRVPRIAVNNSHITSAATLAISGEPGSTVKILLNNQAHGSVVLNSDGQATYNLTVADLPDGTLVVRAYGLDAAANQSELGQSLALQKDTQGPALARADVSFILSPAFDLPQALVRIGQSEAAQATLEQNGQEFSASDSLVTASLSSPFTLALQDEAGNRSLLENISLAPTFAVDSNQSYLAPPSRFSQLTRRLTAAIFATILALLVLSILIRIRIQRPALIAHASLVLCLAASLFFW